MDYEVFDNVKHEKQKAIARFNRFRKIAKLMQLLEVIVALVLVSWSTTRLPAVFRFSGEFLVEASLYVFNPHIVFLIGNAIIIALVVLCRRTDSTNSSATGPDLYDEYPVPVTSDDEKPQPVQVETTAVMATSGVEEEEKQIVCMANEVAKYGGDDDVAEAIEKATKQIRRFERTQSEKLRREIAPKPTERELRRSETDIVVSSAERRKTATSFDTVDNLSSEEFRRTVEAFIYKRRSDFKKEKLAESKQGTVNLLLQ